MEEGGTMEACGNGLAQILTITMALNLQNYILGKYFNDISDDRHLTVVQIFYGFLRPEASGCCKFFASLFIVIADSWILRLAGHTQRYHALRNALQFAISTSTITHSPGLVPG